MQVAGQPLEHVARMDERVQRERHGHENHADDDDHEGGLGAEELVAVLVAGFDQELVVMLALGLGLAEEKVAALPEAFKRNE